MIQTCYKDHKLKERQETIMLKFQEDRGEQHLLVKEQLWESQHPIPVVLSHQDNPSNLLVKGQLKSDKPEIEYKSVYSNNNEMIKKVYRRFEENLKER